MFQRVQSGGLLAFGRHDRDVDVGVGDILAHLDAGDAGKPDQAGIIQLAQDDHRQFALDHAGKSFGASRHSSQHFYVIVQQVYLIIAGSCQFFIVCIAREVYTCTLICLVGVRFKIAFSRHK